MFFSRIEFQPRHCFRAESVEQPMVEEKDAPRHCTVVHGGLRPGPLRLAERGAVLVLATNRQRLARHHLRQRFVHTLARRVFCLLLSLIHI